MADEVKITSGQLSQAQKEFVQKSVMMNLEDLTRDVLFKYAEKVNFEPTSDTYTWRKYALNSRTSAHLIEGVSPEGIDYKLTDYSVKVYQEGNFIPLTDKMLKYGIDKQLAISGELLGEDAKERMASLLNAVVFGGTNVVYAQGQASRATVLSNTKGITIADLNKIKANFRRRKVKPADGNKYIFLATPEVIADIKNLDAVNKSWIDVEKYGDQTDIIDGEVGSFMGFRFVEFLGCPVVDTNVHCCLAFGKEAFGTVAIDGEDAAGGFEIIYHSPDEGGVGNELNQKGSIGWKHNGFNGRILRDEALVRYECYHSEAIVTDITESNRAHYKSASGKIVPTLTAGTNTSIEYVGNCAPGNILKATVKAGTGHTLASTKWTTASFVGVDVIQGAAGDATIFVQVKKDATAVTLVSANAAS